jgi:Xaa-Pro aminopeptidase
MPRHQERTAELRRRLDRLGLGSYWVVNELNVRYLSGFAGDDATLLVTPERSVLITDSRYVEEAERSAAADEVVSRHRRMAPTVAALCGSLGVGRLAFAAKNLPYAGYMALKDAAPALDLMAGRKGIVEAMRRRKDADEVAAIRRALTAAQEAFQAVLPEVRAGQTERDLAALLEYEMRLRGAEKASFDIICAADERASVPHAVTGGAELRPGGMLLVDWGARRDGYCCDLTRMVCVDRIPKAAEDLAEVVLEAQEAVFGQLRPGRKCAEADAAGRAVVAKAGYGHRFGHGMGHGVGLAVHEDPRLGPGSDTVLLPGMVVTVEPGIYLPGRTGVRIEEMVLITPDGHEVLSDLPRRAVKAARAAGAGAADND